MPVFAFLVVTFLKTVFEFARRRFLEVREARPAPLCKDCLHAHVQYSTNAQLAISCMYGGTLRPLKTDVLYCTDYQSRSLPARERVIGFVREIASAE